MAGGTNMPALTTEKATAGAEMQIRLSQAGSGGAIERDEPNGGRA